MHLYEYVDVVYILEVFRNCPTSNETVLDAHLSLQLCSKIRKFEEIILHIQLFLFSNIENDKPRMKSKSKNNLAGR